MIYYRAWALDGLQTDTIQGQDRFCSVVDYTTDYEPST